MANGSASLSICGVEFAPETGKRSERIAPIAKRKQRRKNAVCGAQWILARGFEFSVMVLIRTQRAGQEVIPQCLNPEHILRHFRRN
jgi:hypothetical protein